VVVAGPLADPRPAYAAADIALGMGGSALRALAFGRPLVVQGENAFWELLTPQSLGTFLHQGWYGRGDGTGAVERLTHILCTLVDDPALRRSLGAFGRQLAVDRFSLQAAAVVQEEVYRQALVEPQADGPGRFPELASSATGLIVHKARRRYGRWRGTTARDDFNAPALTGAALRRSPQDATPAG
jgi:hypothetical protein